MAIRDIEYEKKVQNIKRIQSKICKLQAFFNAVLIFAKNKKIDFDNLNLNDLEDLEIRHFGDEFTKNELKNIFSKITEAVKNFNNLKIKENNFEENYKNIDEILNLAIYKINYLYLFITLRGIESLSRVLFQDDILIDSEFIRLYKEYSLFFKNSFRKYDQINKFLVNVVKKNLIKNKDTTENDNNLFYKEELWPFLLQILNIYSKFFIYYQNKKPEKELDKKNLQELFKKYSGNHESMLENCLQNTAKKYSDEINGFFESVNTKISDFLRLNDELGAKKRKSKSLSDIDAGIRDSNDVKRSKSFVALNASLHDRQVYQPMNNKDIVSEKKQIFQSKLVNILKKYKQIQELIGKFILIFEEIQNIEIFKDKIQINFESLENLSSELDKIKEINDNLSEYKNLNEKHTSNLEALNEISEKLDNEKDKNNLSEKYNTEIFKKQANKNTEEIQTILKLISEVHIISEEFKKKNQELERA